MLHKKTEIQSEKLRKYSFSHHEAPSREEDHYVKIDRELTINEILKLNIILKSFPHASDNNWPNKFKNLDISLYPKELLSIAANAYDRHGNTMLGVAAEKGEIEAVQRLIKLGAVINTPDHLMNKLPLHWAICSQLAKNLKQQAEYLKIIKLLLDNNALVDIPCYAMMTVTEYAKDREYNVASDFIEDYLNEKIEAIFTAANNCNISELKKSLNELSKNKTININSIKNSRGESLLMVAAQANMQAIPDKQVYDMVQYLLQQGVDPLLISNDGRTPLMQAAAFCRESVIDLLISALPINKRVTYIDQKDNVNATAKRYATIISRNVKQFNGIINKLDKRKEEATSNLDNLEHLNECVNNNDLFAIKVIIENHKKKSNQALSLNDHIIDVVKNAILLGRVEIVDYFLEEGISANSYAYEHAHRGSVAPFIYYAAKLGNLAIVKLLIENHATISPRDDYFNRGDDSAIKAAVENGHTEIVEYLLEHGAKVDGTTGIYRFKVHTALLTYLAQAAYDNNVDMVESLVNHGANVKTALICNYNHFIDTINIHQESISSTSDEKLKAEINVKITQEKTRYQNAIRLLMNYAMGVDLTEHDGLDGSKNNMDIFTNLDLSSMNFCGVSLDGKPITHEILRTKGLKEADSTIDSFDEVTKHSIAKEENFVKLHTRIESSMKKLGKLADEKTGVINLVPLNKAAEIGDIAAVKIRLSAGVDPNSNKTLLIAAKFGHLGIVKLITNHNPFDKALLPDAIDAAKSAGKQDIADFLNSLKDIDQADEDGNTSLHRAANAGNITEVTRLIALGAKVNLKNKSEDTPLNIAARKSFDNVYYGLPSPNHIKIIQILLANKANPNIEYNNHTALHIAVYAGSGDATELLLPVTLKKSYPVTDSWGVKIGEKPWFSELIFTGKNSPERIKILTLLHQAGADLSINDAERNQSDLIHMALRDFPVGFEVISEVTFKLRMSILNRDDKYPMNDAIERNQRLIKQNRDAFEQHFNYLNFLVNHGAYARLKLTDKTLLHTFLNDVNLEYTDRGYERILDLFLKNGLDINAADKDGKTLLHIAAEKNKFAAAKYLLERGANLNALDSNNQTPLHLAAANGSETTAQLLINYGADISTRDQSGLTPVQTSKQALESYMQRYHFYPEFEDVQYGTYRETHKILLAAESQHVKVSSYRAALFAPSNNPLPTKVIDVIGGYTDFEMPFSTGPSAKSPM